MNGQEKESEINENITTAEYWEYDSRIGRRWNRDPKPIVGISVYSVFQGNPMYFSDANGDTTINGQRFEAGNPAAATYIEPVIVFAKKRFIPYPSRVSVEPSTANNELREILTWKMDKANDRKLAYHRRNGVPGGVAPDHIDRGMSQALSGGSPGSNLLKNVNGAVDVLDAAYAMQSLGNGKKLDLGSIPLPFGADILFSAANDVMEPLEFDILKEHYNSGYSDYIQFYFTSEIGKKSTLLNVYVTDAMLKKVKEKGYYCMNEAGHGYRGVAWNHPYSPSGERYTYILTFDQSESKYDAKITNFGVLKIDLK